MKIASRFIGFSSLFIVAFASTSCAVEDASGGDELRKPELTIIPIRLGKEGGPENKGLCLSVVYKNILGYGMNLDADGFDDGYFYLDQDHASKDERLNLQPFPVDYDPEYDEYLCDLVDAKDNIEYHYTNSSYVKDERASFVYHYDSLFDKGFYCVVVERDSKSAMERICLENIAQHFAGKHGV
ncbi:hypothetical protein [Sphingorhabdus sp. Alg231-15]|uniref:hypothetical protein n=1 Tax=Sphingorhabdus sp. Alg231-15 TaxID=1922222 RepID=UPI000D55C186